MSDKFRFILRSVIPLAIILMVSHTAAQTRIQSTDAETRLEWFRQHQALQEKTPFNNMAWRHIGPEIMSGRIIDVAIPRALSTPSMRHLLQEEYGKPKTKGRRGSPLQITCRPAQSGM